MGARSHRTPDHGPDPELTRNIGRENARMHAGERLQKFAGIEIEGEDVGVVARSSAPSFGARQKRSA